MKQMFAMSIFLGPKIGSKLDIQGPRPEFFENEKLGPGSSPNMLGPRGPEARKFSARVGSSDYLSKFRRNETT